jgi:hypothetical protein
MATDMSVLTRVHRIEHAMDLLSSAQSDDEFSTVKGQTRWRASWPTSMRCTFHSTRTPQPAMWDDASFDH